MPPGDAAAGVPAELIIDYDRQLRAVYAKPAALTQLKVGPEALIGRTPIEMASEGGELAAVHHEAVLDEVLRTGTPAELRLKLPGLPPLDVVMHAIGAEQQSISGVRSVARPSEAPPEAGGPRLDIQCSCPSLLENSLDLIARYDRAGRCTYANPALRGLLGLWDRAAKTALPGHGFAQDEAAYARLVFAVLASGQSRYAAMRFIWASGEVGWFDVRFCPEIDAAGAVCSVLTVARDITPQVERRDIAQALALTDPLTGLYSRQMLYRRTPEMIADAQRAGQQLCVMVLDLDRFKAVNETLGHPVGDRILIETARRIAACIGADDLLVRLGGDEFAIIARCADAGSGMSAMAGRIELELGKPLSMAGQRLKPHASMGVALYPDDGHGLDVLLANAESAMYQAKRLGRKRCVFYRKEFTERAFEQAAMEHELWDAQFGEGLELFFQPLVDLDSGRPVGAEALLRWHHPRHGFLAPDRFVELAEEIGAIVPIGRWVIEQVALAAVRCNVGRESALRLSFNTSTRQFFDDDLVAVVQEVLARTGCRPQWLTVEVTESLLLEDCTRVQQTLNGLSRLGLRIALDDFGTGYSALSYLSKFDVDSIKIDRQFVSGIEQDSRQAELVKAFLAIARALHLGVVAEGVETPAQAAFLRDQGCGLGQGYLFMKPASLAEFHRFLAAS